MFPSERFLETAPPSLGGVHRDSSPASSVLWGAQTPCRSSRRTSLPSFGATTVASCLLPSAGTCDRGLRGVVIPVPEPEVAVEATGSPRFLGIPDGHRPCSPTPVGPIAFRGTRCNATDTAPAHVHNEGSRHLEFSGLNHTAFDLAVYASQ